MDQTQCTFMVDDQIEKDLAMYCKIMDVTKDSAINEAISRLVASYMPDDNMPLKAVYHAPGIHESDNLDPQNTEGQECWYIGATSMFGATYRRIVMDGRLMSVPAGCVDITGF